MPVSRLSYFLYMVFIFVEPSVMRMYACNSFNMVKSIMNIKPWFIGETVWNSFNTARGLRTKNVESWSSFSSFCISTLHFQQRWRTFSNANLPTVGESCSVIAVQCMHVEGNTETLTAMLKWAQTQLCSCFQNFVCVNESWRKD